MKIPDNISKHTVVDNFTSNGVELFNEYHGKGQSIKFPKWFIRQMEAREKRLIKQAVRSALADVKRYVDTL